MGYRQAVRLRTLTPSSGSSNLSTPAKQKEQASACSFCFICEAVKERFELRATPSGGKTVLRTVFSDDRRYLQSIGLNFRICFANIKRKISPPQPLKSQVLPEIFYFYGVFNKRRKRLNLPQNGETFGESLRSIFCFLNSFLIAFTDKVVFVFF